MCYYPNYESLKMNAKLPYDSTSLEVDLQSNLYKFSGLLTLNSSSDSPVTKQLSVCLNNENDSFFQATRSIVQLLKQILCREPYSCVELEDLNKFEFDSEIAGLKLRSKIQSEGNSGKL